ncbi:MAG: peptidoglycan bridge formation glycyltransferase FemA/FemB family protein [Planctomycetes bacterium]|nr:peptidoglycan bridge formation glycyltransferase FemA/FemB family protein [Planctomycetota bacterium]
MKLHYQNRKKKKQYSVAISPDVNSEDWDKFVSIEGGNHVQSSHWARAKTVQNWKSVTIVLKDTREIIAGAQMLYRSLPIKFTGSTAYIPKGPIFKDFRSEQFILLMQELEKLLKLLRVRHLIVQPPLCQYDYTDKFFGLGFCESRISFASVSTVVVDLKLELDEILSRMKQKTRYNLKKAERQGITVREGNIKDLKTFHRLLLSTAARQNFSTESEEFFLKLWNCFMPTKNIKLFITQYRGVDLSAILLIAFGDTVIYKRGAWFGKMKNLKPNEFIHWTAIKWAKSQGFRYYDFEGIDPKAANLAMDGKPLPESYRSNTHRFKLGFGGDLVWNPKPYEYIPNWSYRVIYQFASLFMHENSTIKKLLNWMRTR